MIVWFDLVVGAVAMATSLLVWLRGRRRDPMASRWSSGPSIGLGLCAWFAAAAGVSSPRMAQIWHLLVYVTALLAICSLIVAAVQRSARNRQDSDPST
jgi:hypothetical protein